MIQTNQGDLRCVTLQRYSSLSCTPLNNTCFLFCLSISVSFCIAYAAFHGYCVALSKNQHKINVNRKKKTVHTHTQLK